MSSSASSQFEYDAKPSAYAWLVWACSALFFFYEFCLQSSPSVMVPELMQAFHVNASQLGKLSAYYFYAYALMQLPIGLLLDRFGPRIIMTIACFICALGALIFSHTDSFYSAELARFFMGLGSACALISALKLASLWFPPNRYSLLIGFLLMFGMMGAIGGQVPLSIFVNHYGWRDSMEVLSITGFILSILFYLLVRNGNNFKKTQALQIDRFSFSGLKNVLCNKQIWLLSLYAAFMYAPTPAFGELWGVPFIVTTFSISATLAAKVVAMVFVGWMVGSPVFGFLADRSGKHSRYIRIGTWASLLVMISIVFIGQTNIWLMGSLLFAFGFFSSAFALVFTLVKEAIDIHFAATASGFLNGLNELVPGLLQAAIGLALDASWHGTIQNGVRHYTVANYHNASFSLIVVIAIAVGLLYWIRQKK
jgi:MFS family permease